MLRLHAAMQRRSVCGWEHTHLGLQVPDWPGGHAAAGLHPRAPGAGHALDGRRRGPQGEVRVREDFLVSVKLSAVHTQVDQSQRGCPTSLASHT